MDMLTVCRVSARSLPNLEKGVMGVGFRNKRETVENSCDKKARAGRAGDRRSFPLCL